MGKTGALWHLIIMFYEICSYLRGIKHVINGSCIVTHCHLNTMNMIWQLAYCFSWFSGGMQNVMIITISLLYRIISNNQLLSLYSFTFLQSCLNVFISFASLYRSCLKKKHTFFPKSCTHIICFCVNEHLYYNINIFKGLAIFISDLFVVIYFLWTPTLHIKVEILYKLHTQECYEICPSLL